MIKYTQVGKDIRGSWRASSVINVGDDSLECKVVTSKTYSGEIQSHITVGRIEGSFVSHTMYQDYSKLLSSAKVRCTENTIRVRHAQALEIVTLGLLEPHIKAIQAQYKIC